MHAVPAVIIDAIRFPSDIEEYFVNLMQKHGIHVRPQQDMLQLVFPAGTFKKQVSYHTVHTTHYMITLPDGFVLYEYVYPDKRVKSGIAFQIADVPQTILNAHPRGVCHNHP